MKLSSDPRLDLQLEKSLDILRTAMDKYQPQVVVSLVSGGNDSLTAFYVAQRLKTNLDRVVHAVTGTGIPETRQFVEQWSNTTGVPLLEESAGTAYEDYVRRKGFFGVGVDAHTMAYHKLKADPLRRAMSKLRQRRRHYPIFMLTGIRLDESLNRKYNFANQTVKRDHGKDNNIFVNFIEHWSAEDCQALLAEVKAPRNPVSKALHHSRECCCGTMQSKEERQIAGSIYPHWGKWLDALEKEVRVKFDWGWGEAMPKSVQQERKGQLALPGFELCRNCILEEMANESSTAQVEPVQALAKP